MKQILVTGGSGLVGKHLQEILPNATYLSSKDCDLTDIKMVRWMISSYTPDIIIHLAAIAHKFDYKTMTVNCLMTKNIIAPFINKKVRF